ncbi:hypothetical protein J14TS2_38640 [Bacillus sp. J14TS2]|uniref:hypothetical protein n=1 Tax=Bacillus sp. J14TS2 TaxID=2807188 RepID=UPI001AFF93BB|nr:hypothetical protein [Bacillus sp. J14TS2]GIN73389.1 hypothetical protein J14TS2_38640 [Bacillus sp. J14TS2]
MIQQLKHDIFYVIYNRKYRLLVLLTILLTAGLIIYTAVNVTVEEDTLIQAFGNFRQFFWILCAYLIADLLSTDYHSQTFKNVIPKSSNRNYYYLSKIMIATVVGVFILLVHIVTSWVVMGSVAAGIELNYFNIPYFFLGAVLSLLLFSSLLSIVITLSGKETVTIGAALGLVLLQILVEGLDPTISAHFPTLYVVSLQDLVLSNSLTGIISIGSYIIFTFLFFVGTIKLFNKQDLFI